MGMQLTRLREQERGSTKSRPTWLRDPNNEAHSSQSILDKSCKINA
jgi:hypothetical protein